MHKPVDRYNYSFWEKNSHNKSHGASNEDNLPTAISNARLGTFTYSKSPNHCKNSATSTAKKEHVLALDKECKRLAVLYPFLSKDQIRNKAKEALQNAPRTAPSKRHLVTTPKGKAVLDFVNEPGNGFSKPRAKRQKLSTVREEEESDFAPNSKARSKLKRPCQREDDDHDDDDDDPDYEPGGNHRASQRSVLMKTSRKKVPKTKKVYKSLAKKSECGFMDLGENMFTDIEEFAPFKRVPSSKMEPIQAQHGSFKAQTQPVPVIRTSKETYKLQDKFDTDLKFKSNKTTHEPTTHELVDKSLNDDFTQQSHVSESPDSTTATNSTKKPYKFIEPDSNFNPAHPITVPTSPIIQKASTCSTKAANKTPLSPSLMVEDIFASSKLQQQNRFPKYAVEDGYEVITLSSDSEDDVTSTARPMQRAIANLPINITKIKAEKDSMHVPPKEQSMASLLIKNPVTPNLPTADGNLHNKSPKSTRPEPMLRSILKYTPQSRVQSPRMIQTPKSVKYKNPPKQTREASTQMTPPRSHIQINVRPLMKDKASAANMAHEKYAEFSSLVSPTLSQTHFPNTHGVYSIQNQLEEAVRRIEKTIIGRARQIQCAQVSTPKLCSAQTQTDPPATRDGENGARFHFLPSFQTPSSTRPNLETPHKRFISWNQDRALKMTENNVAKIPQPKEKLVSEPETENNHDRFLQSVISEMELLSENKKFKNCISDRNVQNVSQLSNLDVSPPESMASTRAIATETLTRNKIPDVAKNNNVANEWCSMFNSLIHSHANSNRIADDKASKSFPGSKNKMDENGNINTDKKMILKQNPDEQTASVAHSNYCGSIMFSSLEESSTTESGAKTTDSQTSSEGILSTSDEICDVDSEESSVNSPVDLVVQKQMHTIQKNNSKTPTKAKTQATNPESSLLDTILSKMRRFSSAASINEKPEESTLTPSHAQNWSTKCQSMKVLSEPQHNFTTSKPCIMLHESAMGSSSRILTNQIRTPKTPQKTVKIYGNSKSFDDYSIKKPVQKQILSPQDETGNKTLQANSCVKNATPKKDLLCDLFDVATPKSAGGTLNRYLGYSIKQQTRPFFDEDYSDVFG